MDLLWSAPHCSAPGSALSWLGPDICMKSSLSSEMSSSRDCRAAGGRCSRSSMKSHKRTLFINWGKQTKTALLKNYKSLHTELMIYNFGFEWKVCLTRTFPSELSCFRGRSGSGRDPSGKAWRYKHFPPNGHEPRPWSKYLQAFFLHRQEVTFISSVLFNPLTPKCTKKFHHQ